MATSVYQVRYQLVPTASSVCIKTIQKCDTHSTRCSQLFSHLYDFEIEQLSADNSTSFKREQIRSTKTLPSHPTKRSIDQGGFKQYEFGGVRRRVGSSLLHFTVDSSNTALVVSTVATPSFSNCGDGSQQPCPGSLPLSYSASCPLTCRLPLSFSQACNHEQGQF
jgi:hypothetical protein